MRVLCGTILVMLATAAAAWTPGGEYAGGGASTNAVNDPYAGNVLPQNQNVTVIGRISTNDVAIFTDRTGRFVRGTNIEGQVRGWVTEATTGAVTLATLATATATGALGLAQAALPKIATNGWETGAHRAWLTNETDTLALAALATNRVSLLWGTNEWIDGDGWIWTRPMLDDSNTLVIAYASALWNGDAVGTRYMWNPTTEFFEGAAGMARIGYGGGPMPYMMKYYGMPPLIFWNTSTASLTNDYVGDGEYTTGYATLAFAQVASSNLVCAGRMLRVEADTLATVSARGGFAGTETITVSHVICSNLTATGKLTLANTQPTNLVTRVYMSNEFIVVEHVIP